jgi:indole-3-glycerol phosphate synthase
MSDILQTILGVKREEVAASKRRVSQHDLASLARVQPAPLGFGQALSGQVALRRPAVIAEIKRASPSKGVIRQDFDAASIALAYAKGGATCLSVLTDPEFFKGSREDLVAARAACSLPLLRKDFMIDEYQIVDARALGADCILLIVAALSKSHLMELAGVASELGMDVLVEVHDEAEMDVACEVSGALIGINNRDLRTFQTDINTSMKLAERSTSANVLVSESGIHTSADLKRLSSAGIYAFLIGEAFMAADDPGHALRALIEGFSAIAD